MRIPAAFVGLLALSSSLVYAETKSHLLCRNGSDVRTIQVQKNSSFCETTYTKSGKSEVVSKSFDLNNCERVRTNIQANLEKASWVCRDVTGSRVSSFEE